MRAVEAGGDRQEAHEVIRKHSVAAAHCRQGRRERNDMLDRLAADPDYACPYRRSPETCWTHVASSGAPSEQVTEFLHEVVVPLLDESAGDAIRGGTSRMTTPISATSLPLACPQTWQGPRRL